MRNDTIPGCRVALKKPALPGQYEVIAVFQDNRENTFKVAAVCENSFEAVEALVETTCVERCATREDIFETWSLLYCSTRYIEEQ